MYINKIKCLWKIHHADEEWLPQKQLSLHKALNNEYVISSSTSFKEATIGFVVLSKGFACMYNTIVNSSFEYFSKNRECSDTMVIISISIWPFLNTRVDTFCRAIRELPILDNTIQYPCYYTIKFMFT